MLNTERQLLVAQSVLNDVSDLAIADSEQHNTLNTVGDVIRTYSEEGLSPDSVAILKALLPTLDVPAIGLENYTDDRVASTRYVAYNLEQLVSSCESELSGTMESFLDVFRSFDSRTLAWIDEAGKEIAELQSALPRDGKTTRTVDGKVSGLVDGANDVLNLTQYITVSYRKQLTEVAAALTEQMRKVFAARNDIDVSVRDMKKLRTPTPQGFQSRAAGYTSSEFLGGKVLTLILDGTDSKASVDNANDAVELTITTEQALAAGKKLTDALRVLKDYIKQREKLTKGVDKSANRRDFHLLVPALLTILLTSMLGPLHAGLLSSIASLSNTEIRRRFQLIFKDDNQKDLVHEMRAATKLIDLSVDVTRAAVSEWMAIAKAIKA